ncbi:uncharacterized protein LOC116139300 [Pistacia vera]|uniref:uncharacterized protein LOC116139300 n=1 Tax=Pistacia vera TaxID=55513 RepID=UPI001262B4E2|nr:uncharacterized protein LOC116139300 [Pistacia vera]
MELTMDMLAQLMTRVVQDRMPGRQGEGKTIERARKLRATDFEGTRDPTDAYSWMDQLEQVFGMMECTDDQKLRFATFLLKGRAHHWWRSVQLRYGDPTTITWANFLQDFFDHYFPVVYQDAKQSEFLRLTQGNMSVEEYLIKFIELSRFAQLIVGNERAKCRRFEEGLREIAMRTESNLGEFDKREPRRPKRSNREWTVGGPSNRN